MSVWATFYVLLATCTTRQPWKQDWIQTNFVRIFSCTQNTHIPWKSIATSWPVWAINVGFITSDWCFYSLLICIPLYMKQVLHFDVAQVTEKETNAAVFKLVITVVEVVIITIIIIITIRRRRRKILIVIIVMITTTISVVMIMIIIIKSS